VTNRSPVFVDDLLQRPDCRSEPQYCEGAGTKTDHRRHLSVSAETRIDLVGSKDVVKTDLQPCS